MSLWFSLKSSRQVPPPHLPSYLMTWLMIIGSGGISNAWSRCGISENFIRWDSNICMFKEEFNEKEPSFSMTARTGVRTLPFTCWRYLSQMTYSRSWGSCSLWVLMYCHRAWMITGRVWVWIPKRRAKRGSSLNCGGCKEMAKTNFRVLISHLPFADLWL